MRGQHTYDNSAHALAQSSRYKADVVVGPRERCDFGFAPPDAGHAADAIGRCRDTNAIILMPLENTRERTLTVCTGLVVPRPGRGVARRASPPAKRGPRVKRINMEEAINKVVGGLRTVVFQYKCALRRMRQKANEHSQRDWDRNRERYLNRSLRARSGLGFTAKLI
ncbi:hypothetical protein EVAR_7613_1 [Eumeta japonica]|uniref:Uncharacterized protein n=1 Tax=Eumeta variegata TaxID=151549 RepID=A0A4C1TI11_EUMVA|nr:hypothetical protein EVAR_7613_1 [Eumeta japonica]